jgi:AcrR family transcriptional regulator
MPKELSGDDVEAVRARIGAAATALYAAKGAGAITIRDIAKKLGRSPMGLYRYFQDREEILAFVRADAFNRFADALEAAFASGDDAFARARLSRLRLAESQRLPADVRHEPAGRG